MYIVFKKDQNATQYLCAADDTLATFEWSDDLARAFAFSSDERATTVAHSYMGAHDTVNIARDWRE